MAKEIARELIGAGVHFGHAVSRWNPKMDPFIFGKRGMIHIIDVKETLKGMLIAKKLLAEVVSTGKDVVFVGTKRQAKEAVTKAAHKCGMHYICERWLGGSLTNFQTIRSRLKRLEELEELEKSGQLDAGSKKEGARLKRELTKIKTNLEGIRNMNKLPGAVVVVDVKKEYIAAREALKLDIPTVGIIDTDANPDTIDVAIPANDDSIKAVDILLDQLADGVNEGKTMYKQGGEQKGPILAGRRRSRRKALATADGRKPEEDESAADDKEKMDATTKENAGTASSDSSTTQQQASQEQDKPHEASQESENDKQNDQQGSGESVAEDGEPSEEKSDAPETQKS